MAGTLDGMRVEAKQLSHEDVTGVGYGVCSFHPTIADDSRKFLDMRQRPRQTRMVEKNSVHDPWVQLAVKSIESYVRHQKVMEVPDGLPSELIDKKAGAFVSIHKRGKLRGCIGTISPTKNSLAEEIIHNAISAATRDSRFEPIDENELSQLEATWMFYVHRRTLLLRRSWMWSAMG